MRPTSTKLQPNALDQAFLTFNGLEQPVITLAMDCYGIPPAPDDLTRRVAERAPRLPHFAPEQATGTQQAFHTAVGPGGIDAETDRIARSPFDLTHDRPPWDVHFITDLEGCDFFRVCLRVHHGFLDGVGATHAAAALLTDEAGEGARLYAPAAPAVRALARVCKDLALALARRPAWHPPHDATPPLSDTRSAYQDLPLTTLRRLADLHGASVNEVSLAALGLALADWQHDHLPADSRRDVTAGVVMSTRTPQERHHIGNRVGFHRLTLPHQVRSLTEFIPAVTRQTGKVRSVRQRDAFRPFLDTRITPRLGTRAFRAALHARANPLILSSVSLPQQHTVFGADLRAASLRLNVFPDFPAYISFTRTRENVRCTAVADQSRNSLLAVPRRWAQCLG